MSDRGNFRDITEEKIAAEVTRLIHRRRFDIRINLEATLQENTDPALELSYNVYLKTRLIGQMTVKGSHTSTQGGLTFATPQHAILHLAQLALDSDDNKPAK